MLDVAQALVCAFFAAIRVDVDAELQESKVVMAWVMDMLRRGSPDRS
jgi:hypothetical protein